MSAPKRMAIKVALLSTSRFRVGCVIAQGRRILSAGYNQMDTTHPCMGSIKRLHAETHALTTAHGDLTGTTAFVARVLADGTFGDSRPCEICIEQLKERGVESICYTVHNKWIKEKI